MKIVRWLALLLACIAFGFGQTATRADRTPDWLVGRYRGHNRKYDVDVVITVHRSGRVTTVGRFHDGRRTRDTGNYRDGIIKMADSGTYVVSRADRGIKVIQTTDQNNTAFYRRVDGDFRDEDDDEYDRAADNAVPDWLIGRFEGYNRKYRVRVELNIRPDGDVRTVGRSRDGRRTNDSGTYRDGKLLLGNSGSYYVDRIEDGIRLTQTTDAGNSAVYHRAN